MTFLLLFIIFSLGLVLGYKAQQLMARWRRELRRRAFRPVLLRPYEPHASREERNAQ